MSKDFPYDEEPIKVPRFHESGGFYTTRQRSKTMAKIKGKNTKPEMMLRRALWAKNLRFRIHDKELAGKPDIIIKKYKLVIFVDGEFWHGYQWDKTKSQIKTNRAFWIPKIERNMQKDRSADRQLQDLGYTVFRFWADDVRKSLEACVNQVMLYIESAKEIRIPYSDY